ncbi:MAG TPA: TadE/TadG family type IV pilus assembly protein [Solimonas sp.]|nr:TadE/TadG family type IV pilus assembly protein [Solimonas sp.]
MNTRFAVKDRRLQRGAAVVEFAFIFPIFFFLMYGTLVYGYIFVLNQSVNFAAQQAAEAAVAVAPDADDFDALRQQRVTEAVNDAFAWLPAAQRSRLVVCDGAVCPVDEVDNTISVEVEFTLSTPGWLFPVIDMPGIGAIPPMPNLLRSTAAAQL